MIKKITHINFEIVNFSQGGTKMGNKEKSTWDIALQSAKCHF